MMASQTFPTHSYEGLGVNRSTSTTHLPLVPEPPCEMHGRRCQNFARCASEQLSCVAWVAYCRGLPEDYVETLPRDPRDDLEREVNRGSCKAINARIANAEQRLAIERLKARVAAR